MDSPFDSSIVFFFFFFLLSLPLGRSSIHSLLESMGLPPGLLPKDVRSYNFSSGSGLLQVSLDGPCLTKFDTMALYQSELRANLTHGRLAGVEGLSQEELFLWLPVKDIIVDDPSSGLILIDIGVAHKQLSISLFEDPPDCTAQSLWANNAGGLKESTTTKEEGFGATKLVDVVCKK